MMNEAVTSHSGEFQTDHIDQAAWKWLTDRMSYMTGDFKADFSCAYVWGCHGIEVEHAYLDYQPRTWFNVQLGRLSVPFGEYANRS